MDIRGGLIRGAGAGRERGESAIPRDFKPALAYRFLTRFYDPIVRWTTNERALRAELLSLVTAPHGAGVLDLGCGTGTFALALEQQRSDLSIVALDADSDVLAIARAKAAAGNSAIFWARGRAERLPFGDGAFQTVTSSLFFHHLLPGVKVTVGREIRRVLAPGGSFYLADWTTPGRLRSSIGFRLVELLDGTATTREHRRGRLTTRLREAGFSDVESTGTLDVPLGTIGFWRARRREEPSRPPLQGEP